MKRFMGEVYSLLSRSVNVLTGGTADMTFSARSYRDKLPVEGAIDWVFKTLRGEREHCKVWWKHEVDRCHQTIEMDRQMTDRAV